jgi:Na+/melibiose symporter-like transporter
MKAAHPILRFATIVERNIIVSKLVKFFLIATVIYAVFAIPFIVFLPPDPASMPFYAFAIVVSLVGAVLLLKENR